MQSIGYWRFIVLYLLLALAGLYVYTRSEAAIPVNRPLELFPRQAGSWVMTGQASFDERVLAVLLPSDYLSRTYTDQQGARVDLYIGYHDGGPDSGPIHSPKHCLPGSGWHRLTEETRQLKVADQTCSYVKAIYQKDTEEQLFLYWFQVRDRFLTNEYALKLAQARNSLFSNRRDSSFIRISVPVKGGNEDQALLIGESFIQTFLPAIRASLPH